jgi:hypothetical protein
MIDKYSKLSGVTAASIKSCIQSKKKDLYKQPKLRGRAQKYF